MFTRFKHMSRNQTSKFYDELVQGDKNRFLLGMRNRYGEGSKSQEIFLQKYFDEVIRLEIDSNDHILDFGCGPGIFSKRLATIGGYVVGVDISKEFINRAVNRCTTDNADFIHISSSLKDALEKQSKFDVVVLVDVIHHLDDIQITLAEAFTFLKPGGKVIVYEPNIYNPVLFALHLLDSNERGLLRVGTQKRYRRIFQDLGYICDTVKWNGIVIGPANRLFVMISEILSTKYVNQVIGWLNPKIFLVFRKPI